MNIEQSDDTPVCNISTERKHVEPCSIVIFGASGDLTARKLIPAFYHLAKDGQLPPTYRIIGFARREKTDDAWRRELRAALDQFSRTKPVDEKVWSGFAANLFYCVGDLTDDAAYMGLEKKLGSFDNPSLRRNLLFYLATQPSQFGTVIEQIHNAGLLHRDGKRGWQRIVVEKPFGHDLASARALNAELTRFAHESQVCRIDHYLGKETVQNILMFRFSNSIFERLWNRDSIDHVQITVSEKLGVGERGGYYEEAGALRDMVQNHMLQVLSLVTMEPPVSLESECIHNEKVKLMQSIRHLTPDDVAHQIVRGQYFAGSRGVTGRRRNRQSIGRARSDVQRRRACRFICAPANTCRKAPAKCGSNFAPRRTFCSPRNVDRNWTPTHSRCACSRTREFPCISTAKFPA